MSLGSLLFTALTSLFALLMVCKDLHTALRRPLPPYVRGMRWVDLLFYLSFELPALLLVLWCVWASPPLQPYLVPIFVHCMASGALHRLLSRCFHRRPHCDRPLPPFHKKRAI